MWYTAIDEHGDHELNDSWSALSSGIPVGKPFDDDHGVHETKECHQQGHLSENDENEFNPVAIVDSIHTFDESSHGHLPNTENDGGLHLEAVKVSDFLFSGIPNWVDTEFVYAVLDDAQSFCVGARWLAVWWETSCGVIVCFNPSVSLLPLRGHLVSNIVAGSSESLGGHRGEIIVNESAVSREKAHQ